MSLKDVIEKHLKKLKELPNVNGISGTLKPRIRAGKEFPEELCIRVYVSKKLPESQLKKKEVIPKTIEGYSVDVVEIGEIKALSLDKKAKHRPMPFGVSIGHYQITAGTAGWAGKDAEEPLLIISNNHVLANENKASIGDPILQPGLYDQGNILTDRIGTLHRFVPIKFSEYTCPYRNFGAKVVRFLRILQVEENFVDIACAKPINPDEIKREIVDIGKVKGKRLPNVGEEVQKSGRTSCHTVGGKVVDVDWNGEVGYSRGNAWFVDQVLIEKEGFSAGGDSGSLVLDMENNAVAWLFAGSESFTVANRIENVEKLLGVDLIVES